MAKRKLIYNENCISGAKQHLEDGSVMLGIHDPPFGIEESKLDQLYNRDESYTIDGYVEAPKDYYTFTQQWMQEAKRTLHKIGTMYIVSGWSNADIIGRVIREQGLYLINKLIWTHPFNPPTKYKYVSAHYEIFYVQKKKSVKPIFNKGCRFATSKEQYHDMKSVNTYEKFITYEYPEHMDMQPVWEIKTDYKKGKFKNQNKLPNALIKKMMQYSSNEGDMVCDFFLGNFTTATVAKQLGRKCCGFELNPNAYKHGMEMLSKKI